MTWLRLGPVVLAIVLSLLASLFTSYAVALPQELYAASVVRVIDGDTFVARVSGTADRIRLIGVNTPEATTKVEPYGREATAFARRYLDGKRVWLEYDVQLRDRYGRRLAYVWLVQPSSRTPSEVRAKMFNAILLAEGYAQVSTFPPNVRYVDVFRVLQTEARQQGKGLWAGPTAAGPSVSAECDPSYPDVCIPPPPPDLDCSDIPYRRFRVLPPDPHKFDGDKDGVGCER